MKSTTYAESISYANVTISLPKIPKKFLAFDFGLIYVSTYLFLTSQEKFRREFAVRLPCLRMLKDTQDTKNRRGTEGCLVGHSNTLSEAEHRKLNCRPTSQLVEIHPPRNNRLRVSRVFLQTTQ